MKTLLVSEPPRIVANVLNEDATILIIKNKNEATAIQKLIDENGYAEIYVYCTKGKPYCMVGINNKKTYCDKGGKDSVYSPNHNYIGNGKVVARFYCDKVEKIDCLEHYEPPCDIGIYILPEFTCNEYVTKTLRHHQLLEKACLEDLSMAPSYHIDELDNYLKGKTGYAIHISNLEIFDKPKELSEFYMCLMGRDNCYMPRCDEYKCPCYKQLVKAPKNYCFIEVER